jgi:hypothetical protein
MINKITQIISSVKNKLFVEKFSKLSKEKQKKILDDEFNQDLEKWGMTMDEYMSADKFKIIELELIDSVDTVNQASKNFQSYFFNFVCMTILTTIAGFISIIPTWLFVTMVVINFNMTILSIGSWKEYVFHFKYHYNYTYSFYTILEIVKPEEEYRLNLLFEKYDIDRPFQFLVDIRNKVLEFIYNI